MANLAVDFGSYSYTGDFMASKGITLSHKMGMAFGYLTKALAIFNNSETVKKSVSIQIPNGQIINKDATCYSEDILNKSFAVFKKFTESFPDACDDSMMPISFNKRGMELRYKPSTPGIGYEYGVCVTLEKDGYHIRLYGNKKSQVVKVVGGKGIELIAGVLNAIDLPEKNKVAELIDVIMSVVDRNIVYTNQTKQIIDMPAVKMRSQFNGKCVKCGGKIFAGDEIEWKKHHGSWHVSCPIEGNEIAREKPCEPNYLQCHPMKSYREMLKAKGVKTIAELISFYDGLDKHEARTLRNEIVVAGIIEDVRKNKYITIADETGECDAVLLQNALLQAPILAKRNTKVILVGHTLPNPKNKNSVRINAREIYSLEDIGKIPVVKNGTPEDSKVFDYQEFKRLRESKEDVPADTTANKERNPEQIICESCGYLYHYHLNACPLCKPNIDMCQQEEEAMMQRVMVPDEETYIGYVTIGFSEFNDDVWKTLGEIRESSRISDVCSSIDYWNLLPVLALAGAIIRGEFTNMVDKGTHSEGNSEGYYISIPGSLPVKEFCERMKRVSPINY